MEWLINMLSQEANILICAIVIIITIFIIAARRAHLAHLAKMQTIKDVYPIKVKSVDNEMTST